MKQNYKFEMKLNCEIFLSLNPPVLKIEIRFLDRNRDKITLPLSCVQTSIEIHKY